MVGVREAIVGGPNLIRTRVATSAHKNHSITADLGGTAAHVVWRDVVGLDIRDNRKVAIRLSGEHLHFTDEPRRVPLSSIVTRCLVGATTREEKH